jgi:hypothetical protein
MRTESHIEHELELILHRTESVAAAVVRIVLRDPTGVDLTQDWQKHFESKSGGAWDGGSRLPYPRYNTLLLAGRALHPHDSHFARDTFAPKGGLPGSDPTFAARIFLDAYDLTAAFPIPPEHAFTSALPSHDLARRPRRHVISTVCPQVVRQQAPQLLSN